MNILTKGGEALKVYVDDEVYLEGVTQIIYVGKLHEEALM
jgi:hypothetical protein